MRTIDHNQYPEPYNINYHESMNDKMSQIYESMVFLSIPVLLFIAVVMVRINFL